MSKFFLNLSCELNTSYSLIIEDDARVCYAYLLEENKIIGDVWLYNQRASPSETNWDRRKMPFLNPAEFLIDNVSAEPIKHNSEVNLVWDVSNNDRTLNEVRLIIKGNLMAKLKPGSKPRWSSGVKKDGPLAKVLT